MPAIKQRLRIIAQNFIASSGLYREVNIPWQDIVLAASAAGAYPGASMSASRVSGASGPIALLFAGASSGCFIDVWFRTPQDIAIAAPAAGSGQLWADWTSTSVNSGVATLAACVLQIPSGSEYTATGASQRLGSGCVSVTGASLAQINSSCLFAFNAPTNRTGLMGVRFAYCGQDNATSTASSFALFGLRVRYLADRIGS